MDRFELAANQFKSAIILKSDYIHAHYALGMARMRLREWKAAAKSFESLLTNDPKNGEAWFDLAFAKLAVGETAAAESAFAKSIDFGSVDAVLSHNNIGVILAMKGDLAAAEDQFATAIALSDGGLVEAKHNLEVCRSKRSGIHELVAGELRYAARVVSVNVG
jgi:Flp pilus assembly protein TadD